MHTTTFPETDESQLEPSGLRAYVSSRLRSASTTQGRPNVAVVDALGRSLAAATLPGPQRCVVERALLDSLLNSPPAVAEFSITRGLAAVGVVLQDTSRSLGEAVDVGELDDLVLAAVRRPWLSEIGLRDGLAGMAVYGLARTPDAAGSAIVEHVVLHLQQLSQLGIGGMFWPTSGADPDGAATADLARGCAGIVSVLLAVLDGGFVTDVTLDLIEAHVPWILDHADDNLVAQWGVGPLGPLTVAARAGTRLQRPDWNGRALAGLERLRPRLLEGSIPSDPSLLRGSAGTLVLLQSLAEHTALPWVQTALRRWRSVTASTCLRVLRSNEPINWSLDTGIGGTIRALQDGGTHAPWRMLVGAWENENRRG